MNLGHCWPLRPWNSSHRLIMTMISSIDLSQEAACLKLEAETLTQVNGTNHSCQLTSPSHHPRTFHLPFVLPPPHRLLLSLARLHLILPLSRLDQQPPYLSLPPPPAIGCLHCALRRVLPKLLHASVPLRTSSGPAYAYHPPAPALGRLYWAL